MSRLFNKKSILSILSFGLLSATVVESNLEAKSIYDSAIFINSLEGEPLDLKRFRGKKLLIVNVASKCGFTKQYADLQDLYAENKEHLTIVGVPCNQFLGQEPGDSEQIATFCKKNYGVEFPLTEKIKVKGKEQHELYQWLTQKKRNGYKDSKVKWNFQKYLIDEKGNLVQIFSPNTIPSATDLGIVH